VYFLQSVPLALEYFVSVQVEALQFAHLTIAILALSRPPAKKFMTYLKFRIAIRKPFFFICDQATKTVIMNLI